MSGLNQEVRGRCDVSLMVLATPGTDSKRCETKDVCVENHWKMRVCPPYLWIVLRFTRTAALALEEKYQHDSSSLPLALYCS